MNHWTKLSWISLGCLLICFPLAMVVGEGLLSLLADNPDDPGGLAILIAGGTGTLILMAPMVVSILFGRRGLREGDSGAKIPMIIAGALLVVFLAQTLLGLVVLLL